MKKITAVVLTVALMLILASCGASQVKDKSVSFNIAGTDTQGVYSGGFSKGKPDGIGSVSFGNCSFTGEFSEGTALNGTVEDFPVVMNVSGEMMKGFYSGEMSESYVTGKGVFTSGDTEISGTFDNGTPADVSVSALSLSVRFNGEDVDGTYSGALKNGKPDGKGSFVSDKYEFEGTFKDGAVQKCDVENLAVSVVINGNGYDGTYTGECGPDGPEGTGVFCGDAGSFALTYDGGWSKGAPSGKGTVESNAFVIHFGDVERTGEFSGETVDGIPNGHAVFSAVNANDVAYTVEGEWENGVPNGHCRQELEDGWVCDGRFTDGIFDPTPLELIHYYATDPEVQPYEISAEEDKFITDNTGLLLNPDIEKCKELVNSKFILDAYIKDESSQETGLVYAKNINLYQIDRYSGASSDFDEFSLLILNEVKNGKTTRVWCLTAFGGMDDFEEGDTVSIRYLPLGYSSYYTTGEYWQDAVFGVLFTCE